ncbi:MAG: FtsQ-type POTRA domain-containing protein [Chloroflexota bacterium]|nr:MAG: FtsQ-type POTRA domain-containing protein [Chloroflexota bacterium]
MNSVKHIVLSARWVSLLVLAVCFWAMVTIAGDSSFYLTSIPVEGADAFAASEIVAESGLAGVHVFAADPNEAAKRIGEMPGITSASVSLEWPNVVSIQVTETTPIALWKQNGRTFWIDQDGQIIPARATSSGLLLIESEVDEPLAEDSFVAEDILAGALLLRELRSNIDRLFYEPGNGLSYQDGRGWRAYFGSGLIMEQKLAVYETIVDDLIERAVTPAYISVRNEAKPYYMTSGG